MPTSLFVRRAVPVFILSATLFFVPCVGAVSQIDFPEREVTEERESTVKDKGDNDRSTPKENTPKDSEAQSNFERTKEIVHKEYERQQQAKQERANKLRELLKQRGFPITF